MANVIKLKKSIVAGNIPTTANLALGEGAINHTDQKIYFRHPGTGVVWNFTGGSGANPADLLIACSDEVSLITSGTNKVTFRMPYAMNVTSVRASLTTAQISGNIFTVDINKNGASILSTKITIDNGEKTSTTAAISPVISDTNIADDAEITIDVDQIGSANATGLKVIIRGTQA
jgi:hypothetical protein